MKKNLETKNETLNKDKVDIELPPFFYHYDLKSIKKLQLAQNSATRIIESTPRRAHMTPVLRDSHWLPIVKRCQYKILVFTYNVLHQNSTQYICEMVSGYHPNRQLRSANTTSLVPHRHKSILHGRRLMDTGAAVLWNNLPNNIRCAYINLLFFLHIGSITFYLLC